jgi:hypothetical protein
VSTYSKLKPLLKDMGVSVSSPLFHTLTKADLSNVLTQGLRSRAKTRGQSYHDNAICFSRNLCFLQNINLSHIGDKGQIILVLDKNDLTQHFKTYPIKYYDYANKSYTKMDEYEERVSHDPYYKGEHGKQYKKETVIPPNLFKAVILSNDGVAYKGQIKNIPTIIYNNGNYSPANSIKSGDFVKGLLKVIYSGKAETGFVVAATDDTNAIVQFYINTDDLSLEDRISFFEHTEEQRRQKMQALDFIVPGKSKRHQMISLDHEDDKQINLMFVFTGDWFRKNRHLFHEDDVADVLDYIGDGVKK